MLGEYLEYWFEVLSYLLSSSHDHKCAAFASELNTLLVETNNFMVGICSWNVLGVHLKLEYVWNKLEILGRPSWNKTDIL